MTAIQRAGYDWRNQITLASTIYYYILELLDDAYHADEEKAKNKILEVCEEFDISKENLNYIKAMETRQDIVHYLVRRAKGAAGKTQEEEVYDQLLDVENEVANWESSITYRQLTYDDHKRLSSDQMQDLARLFWESDPYIYPAMCSLKNCFKLVPALFRKNQDRMISLDNIYAGFINDKVVALLLYVKGPLNWSYDALVTLAKDRRITLENTLQKTKDQYFSKYDDVDDNTIQILNLIQCSEGREIDERHSGLLTEHMLNHFLEEHHEACVLYVLEETAGQIEAFHACGFRYVGEKGNGFSADDRDLPCFYMKREAVSD